MKHLLPKEDPEAPQGLVCSLNFLKVLKPWGFRAAGVGLHHTSAARFSDRHLRLMLTSGRRTPYTSNWTKRASVHIRTKSQL